MFYVEFTRTKREPEDKKNFLECRLDICNCQNTTYYKTQNNHTEKRVAVNHEWTNMEGTHYVMKYSGAMRKVTG